MLPTNQIVVKFEEDYVGDLYEASVITQDKDKENEPVSSIIIRSAIIRKKDLGYRYLYDSKEISSLGKEPCYKNFYNAAALEYRRTLYETIEKVLKGSRLGNTQCDILVQCELNNFFSKQVSEGIIWNQENIERFLREHGSSYSCDLIFRHPGYVVLDIMQYGMPEHMCTVQKLIARNDIGIVPIYESF